MTFVTSVRNRHSVGYSTTGWTTVVRLLVEERKCFSSPKHPDQLWGHPVYTGSKGGETWGPQLNLRHAAFIAVPFFCPTSIYIVKKMCIYIYIWLRKDCIWITVAAKEYCEWYKFTSNGCRSKCWLDIHIWSAGLGVTGRIRDIGQNVLQSSFQTGSGSSDSCLQMFFLIAFFDENY